MTIAVGLLGAGHWGKNLARNLAELGVLEVVGDPDMASRERVAHTYPDVRVTADPMEVLADEGLDAVVIAAPAERHEELVRTAIVAGLDVFVEKPLCLDPVAGAELVALAEKEERILMVGHLLWYHPAVLELRRLVDDGELGRLRYIYSNRLNLGKIRRAENILWSFAPHDISVILGLVREEPSRVWAAGSNFLHNQIADVTVSHLEFPSGINGHVFVSWLHPFKEQRLVVVGDKAMAVFDDTAKVEKLLVYPHAIEWREGMPVPTKGDAHAVQYAPDEPLRREMEHFIDCVVTRATPRTDGAEGLRVLRVLAAAQADLSQP